MHDTDQVFPDGDDTLDSLRRERDRLRSQLDMCRHDLGQAQRELAGAREIQESLEERLHAAGEPASSGTTPARAKPAHQTPWTTRLRQRMHMPSSDRTMERDVRLLRESGWFDADWYLAEYPDVARSDVEPARHYLLFGAAEGRNPGPSFNTNAYLRDHHELVEQGINPLVHYLRSEQGPGK